MEYENGKQAPLAVASPAPPEDMDGLISTGALPEPLRSTVNGNLSKVGSTASLRCAAHEYRMLAAGHCHVALYNQLTAWDHAAGWLLHREAGGRALRRFAVQAHAPQRRPAARPTRAAGMPAESADGRGFRGLGKLSRAGPSPSGVPFSGTPPRVIPRSYPHYLWTTLWKAL